MMGSATSKSACRQLACREHGCEKPRFRRGWCAMHYRRVLKYGGPGPAGQLGRKAPLVERFVNGVLVTDDCHLWQGYQHRGYGALRVGNRMVYVHRLAWRLAYGSDPPGQLRWTCGNTLCVRVDHLTLVRRRRPEDAR